MPELLDDDEYPHRRDNLFWGLISAALLSGLGSGVLTITQTEDRYYAEDANRDFELRDERILNIRREADQLRHWVQRIDDTHPPPSLIKRLDDHEERIRELERSSK